MNEEQAALMLRKRGEGGGSRGGVVPGRGDETLEGHHTC